MRLKKQIKPRYKEPKLINTELINIFVHYYNWTSWQFKMCSWLSSAKKLFVELVNGWHKEAYYWYWNWHEAKIMNVSVLSSIIQQNDNSKKWPLWQGDPLFG